MLDKDLQKNIDKINSILPVEKSFDIISRKIIIGEKQGYLLFIDGFAKDDIMLRVLEDLQAVTKGDNINSIKDLVCKKIAYIEVETFDDFDKMKQFLLAGAEILLVDGENQGIIIDAREYPSRSPEESQVEKVTRGARDGLVETIIFNTTLVRRRIRDEQLIFEMTTVGNRSKTDVAIGYIDDLVDKKLLENVKERIDRIDIPSLLMAEKSLEELMIKKKWFNPLPQMKFTERPDVVSAHLMEGHIAIFVDTSPSVMLIPTTVFYFSQYAEDYYQNPLVGTLTRFVRFIAILVALLLVPTWLLIVENLHRLPQSFHFLAVGEEASSGFGILIQLLILELGVELLRLSSLHIPQNLGSSLGIIGGIIVGDLAIDVGFFSLEPIFYCAVTAIATFCIPSVEFASSIRIFRLVILILTGLIGGWGYALGIIIVCLIIYNTETIDNRRKYTWPLIPFNKSSFMNILIRRPIIDVKRKDDKLDKEN